MPCYFWTTSKAWSLVISHSLPKGRGGGSLFSGCAMCPDSSTQAFFFLYFNDYRKKIWVHYYKLRLPIFTQVERNDTPQISGGNCIYISASITCFFGKTGLSSFVCFTWEILY